MSFDLDDLFSEYDDLVADAARSNHTFFKGNLRRWFEFLDRVSPFARPILQQLETAGNFEAWFEPYRMTIVTGGSAQPFEWPDDRRHRLGMQLLLLRRMGYGEIEPGVFALTVLQTGRSVEDGVQSIVDQIFLPMSHDLRRYLKEQTAPGRQAQGPIVSLEELTAAPEAAAKPVLPPMEVLTLKPTLWGIGVDLKELARRIVRWHHNRRAR
jgi:hypothetical protein